VLLRETFPAGPFECNCTVLACEETREAVIIDPGGETERIAEIVAAHDLTVRAIIHTHAHLDHVFCTREVHERHGGTICLHPDDRFLYDDLAGQAAMFGWRVKPTRPVERWLAHDDTIDLGTRRLTVVHTPGHTPGSICFELVVTGERTVVFAGDTLFRGSIGRTDLPGGDSATLRRSIKQRLYTRDLDALVIPGHGPETTLGDEAISNPFVRA